MANTGKINVGLLDTIITIVSFVVTESPETGGDVTTPSDLGTLHAQRINVSGQEEEDGKIVWLNVRKYIVGYSSVIAASGVEMAVRDEDGGLYDIHNVDIIGKKDFLLLKCSKRV